MARAPKLTERQDYLIRRQRILEATIASRKGLIKHLEDELRSLNAELVRIKAEQKA